MGIHNKKRPDNDALTEIYNEINDGVPMTEIAQRFGVERRLVDEWMSFYRSSILGPEGCRLLKRQRDDAAREFTVQERARRRAEIMAPVTPKEGQSIRDLCKPVSVRKIRNEHMADLSRFG